MQRRRVHGNIADPSSTRGHGGAFEFTTGMEGLDTVPSPIGDE